MSRLEVKDLFVHFGGIQALNGVVVEEARRQGKDACANRIVLELVTALEEARR